MGDESPERTEVVCPACGESFSETAFEEKPFVEVDCPECGARSSMGDGAEPPQSPSDPTSAATGDTEAGADREFDGAQASTAKLEAPGSVEAESISEGEGGDLAETEAETVDSDFESERVDTATLDDADAGRGDTFEEGETGKDRESLERARRKSAQSIEHVVGDEGSDIDAADTVDAGLDEISDGEVSSLEELREASSNPELDGAEETSTRGGEDSGDASDASVSTEFDSIPGDADSFDTEVHERETAVSQTPLSERDELPSPSGPGASDGSFRESEADFEETPSVERGEEGGPATTPAAGLDKAIEDTVPPELGEETEAAIDEALRESIESDAETDEGAASNALGEGSLPAPEEALDTDPTRDDSTSGESEGGGEEAPERGTEPRKSGPSSNPPPIPEDLDKDERLMPGEARPGEEGPQVEFPEEGPEDSEPSAPSEEAVSRPDDAEKPPPSAKDLLTEKDSEAGETTEEDSLGGGSEQSATSREPPPNETPSEPEPPPKQSEPPAAADSTSGDDGLGRPALIGFGAIAVLGLVGLVVINPGGILPVSETNSRANGRAAGPAAAPGESGPNLRPAIRAARSELHAAVEVDVSDPELQRAVADRLADVEDYAAAARIYGVLWESRRSDVAFNKSYLDLLRRAGDFRRARRVAIEAMQATDREETFREAFQSALEDDPELNDYEIVTVGALSGVHSIRAADEIDARGYLLEGPDGEPAYIFEPAVSAKPEWRDDVAAWRLCEIIDCGFEIPRTRPAKISREVFSEKFEGDGEAFSSAASKFQWSTMEGPQGKEREYVRGSLRTWRGGLTRWPIEATEVWRDWLSIYSDPGALESPVEESLSELENIGDGSLYRRVLEACRGIETRALAAGLSGVISFDFLTNNWGRFAEEVSAYGTRNHFGEGTFVTIRTDSVFQRRTSTRVKGRFRWISRFRRDFVDSLRLLDRETVSSMLYPDPEWYERAKLEIFWSQRERLLKRVDELVAERGRDDVLIFE